MTLKKASLLPFSVSCFINADYGIQKTQVTGVRQGSRLEAVSRASCDLKLLPLANFEDDSTKTERLLSGIFLLVYAFGIVSFEVWCLGDQPCLVPRNRPGPL